MNESQKWYESRAVWGGIIAVAAVLLQAGGITLDADTQTRLVDYLFDGIAAVGGLLAIWGRITATKSIK